MNKIFFSICFVALGAMGAAAQTPETAIGATVVNDTVAEDNAPILIPPLFEYPMAPDDLPDIESRSNWLLQNFWNPFDFNQTSVSQAALDHAFSVYVSPLRWADGDVANKAIDDLVAKLKKYPPMLYQFTKAAEDNLYKDQAEMWIDGAYLKFVNALLSDKKISDLRKARYKMQKRQLESSMIGVKMPVFDYETPGGKQEKLEFTTPFTVIEFGDPFCTECAMYKVALDTDFDISKMIADGQLAIYYIVPDGESVDGWDRQLAVYPSAWHRGAGKALDESYDVRKTPSVYLLDSNGVILNKFMSTSALRSYLKENRPAQ